MNVNIIDKFDIIKQGISPSSSYIENINKQLLLLNPDLTQLDILLLEDDESEESELLKENLETNCVIKKRESCEVQVWVKQDKNGEPKYLSHDIYVETNINKWNPTQPLIYLIGSPSDFFLQHTTLDHENSIDWVTRDHSGLEKIGLLDRTFYGEIVTLSI
jgi:hypothetical protein